MVKKRNTLSGKLQLDECVSPNQEPLLIMAPVVTRSTIVDMENILKFASPGMFKRIEIKLVFVSWLGFLCSFREIHVYHIISYLKKVLDSV